MSLTTTGDSHPSDAPADRDRAMKVVRAAGDDQIQDRPESGNDGANQSSVGSPTRT